MDDLRGSKSEVVPLDYAVMIFLLVIVHEAVSYSCTVSEIYPSRYILRYIRLPHLRFTPDGGVPLDDLRTILHGGQRMAMVLNGVETLPKISTG